MDFSKFQFKPTQSQNPNFIGESITVEALKEACGGAAFRVRPSREKTHKSGNTLCYFICGQVSGMVAEKLSQKMINGEQFNSISIQEVINPNTNEHMLMAFEQGAGDLMVL